MRRAKIVCTLGPATSSPEQIRHSSRPGWTWPGSTSATAARRPRGGLPRRAAGRATRPVARVGVLVDLQGPKIRLGRFVGGPVAARAPARRFTITTERRPGTPRSSSRRPTTGLPGRRQRRRPDPHRRRQGRAAASSGRRTAGRHPVSRAARCRTTRASTCPGVAVACPRMSDKDKEDLRWGAAARRRLHRAVVRPQRRRHRRRAPDHGRGGLRPSRSSPRSRSRRRSTTSRRSSSAFDGDDGRPRRPRRRAAARAGAAGAEARRRARPAQRQAGHRRDPGARVDDRAPPADPRRGLRRRQRRPRRRRRGDALGRDQRRAVPDRGGADHGPDHRGDRGAGPASASARSARAPTHQGRGDHRGRRRGRRAARREVPRHVHLVAATPRAGCRGCAPRIPLLAFTPDRRRPAASWR